MPNFNMFDLICLVDVMWIRYRYCYTCRAEIASLKTQLALSRSVTTTAAATTASTSSSSSSDVTAQAQFDERVQNLMDSHLQELTTLRNTYNQKVITRFKSINTIVRIIFFYLFK